jgi:hypothetical protein
MDKTRKSASKQLKQLRQERGSVVEFEGDEFFGAESEIDFEAGAQNNSLRSVAAGGRLGLIHSRFQLLAQHVQRHEELVVLWKRIKEGLAVPDVIPNELAGTVAGDSSSSLSARPVSLAICLKDTQVLVGLAETGAALVGEITQLEHAAIEIGKQERVDAEEIHESIRPILQSLAQLKVRAKTVCQTHAGRWCVLQPVVSVLVTSVLLLFYCGGPLSLSLNHHTHLHIPTFLLFLHAQTKFTNSVIVPFALMQHCCPRFARQCTSTSTSTWL